MKASVGLGAVLLAATAGFLLGRAFPSSPALHRGAARPEQRPAARTPGAAPAREVLWYRPSESECRLVEEKRSLALPEGAGAAARRLAQLQLEEALGAGAPIVEAAFLDADRQWVILLSGAAALDRWSASCEAELSLGALVETLLANQPQGAAVRLLDGDAGSRALRAWGPLDLSAPLRRGAAGRSG